MKTAILILFSFVLGISVATAQYVSHEKKGAIIKVIGQGHYSFGNVVSGPELKHEFVIMNIGDEPLQIKEVMNKFAFVHTEWTKEEILPGKKGYIIAYVNTKTKPGTFINQLYIRSNAQNSNSRLGYKLYVVGIIKVER